MRLKLFLFLSLVGCESTLEAVQLGSAAVDLDADAVRSSCAHPSEVPEDPSQADWRDLGPDGHCFRVHEQEALLSLWVNGDLSPPIVRTDVQVAVDQQESRPFLLAPTVDPRQFDLEIQVNAHEPFELRFRAFRQASAGAGPTE